MTRQVRSEDVEYFRRRALQEQLAAGRASCDAARHRHDELAMLYRFKAAMLSTGPYSWADALREPAVPETA
jgi:hypothetical protein